MSLASLNPDKTCLLHLDSGTQGNMSEQTLWERKGNILKKVENANKCLPLCEKHCKQDSNLFGDLPRTCDGAQVACCHQHRPVDGIKAQF